MLQIQSLKAQLSEQKSFAHERIAALLEDRRVAEMDGDAQAVAMRAALEHALERQGGLQEALEATTRDFIKVRADGERDSGYRRTTGCGRRGAGDARRARADRGHETRRGCWGVHGRLRDGKADGKGAKEGERHPVIDACACRHGKGS